MFEDITNTSELLEKKNAVSCKVKTSMEFDGAYNVFSNCNLHYCIKCPQNLQVKTLLQTYTAFTCRIYNEILLKVFDPRNRGNHY